MTSERLQKVLAAAGLGSRRSCEQLIEEGRVTVNNATATLGMSADPAVDKIRVDGRPLPASEPLRTFALYKPRGVVSSLDPQGNRSTVRDLLPVEGRYFPVGRLDLDSEGLILLTNDGDLAQRISHPRYEVEKEYRVLVARRPATEQLQTWRRGVVLSDGFRTAPMQVIVESNEGKGAWLRVIMHEGRKHEIREIGLCIGLPVVRIIRRRIGGLPVGSLRPGQWRELTPTELALFATTASGRPAPRGRRFQRRGAAPRREDNPSQREGRPPQRAGNPPSSGGRTPRRGSDPTQREGRPPRRESTPSQRESRPLRRESNPPPSGGRPPRRESNPTQRGGKPPIRPNSSPRRKENAPRREGRPPRRPDKPTSRRGARTSRKPVKRG